MVLAFVCVRIGSGEQRGLDKAVLEGIRGIPAVLEAHLVFGRYDMIAKVEVKDSDALSSLVVDKVKSIPGVLSTETLIAHA